MRLLNEEGVDQFADSHLFVENVLHKYSSNWDLSNGLSVLDHFSRDLLRMAFCRGVAPWGTCQAPWGGGRNDPFESSSIVGPNSDAVDGGTGKNVVASSNEVGVGALGLSLRFFFHAASIVTGQMYLYFLQNSYFYEDLSGRHLNICARENQTMVELFDPGKENETHI